MGWLHATPESKKDARYESLPEDSPLKEMPEADQRIVSAFHSIGLCEYTMGGACPISWTEINAYDTASCNFYTGWEKEQIRHMSEYYCSWLQKGKNPNQPSPFNPFIEDQEALDKQRGIVDGQWKALKAARRAAKEKEAANKKPPSINTHRLKDGNDIPMF